MKLISRLILSFSLCTPMMIFGKSFTVFHTNDEHSRFLGFAPDSEYNPNVKGDGTVGGIARLAKLLNDRREAAKAKGPVLTLEGGDFSMGTLFHMISREKGPELQFMKLLGYDAITLGNHEFDFGVKGLIQMITSAKREIGNLPPIVASNLVLTDSDPRDEALRQFVKDGVIKPYVVIEKDGMRFGILGILGKDAVEVTANHEPVKFSDAVETVKRLVTVLRKEEKVDVIVVLSHSGVGRTNPDWKGTEVLDVGDDGKWIGEDLDLAKAVPEIDIIVSGHTHTPLLKPIMVGKTAVVQAGAEMRYLGELELETHDSRTKVTSYNLHTVNDQIIGDAAITEKVNGFKKLIDDSILKPLNTSFDQATAKINALATRDYSDNSLGVLLASSFQKAAESDIGFIPDGMIRDDIFPGKTGVQSFSDIFRLLPLGIGEIDEDVGYPLIKVFVNGRELKHIIETMMIAYKFKGSTYYPRFSGIEVSYNPYRIPLDQVTEAYLKRTDGTREQINFQDEKKLYSIGTLSYVGKFFWIIPDVSLGLFTVTPKNADGNPIGDVKESIVFAPGAQSKMEYKGWRALLDYIRTLQVDSASKLPLIPTTGEQLNSALLEMPSLSPSDLFKNATWIQWTGFSLCLFVLAGFGGLGFALSRKMASKKRRPSSSIRVKH